MNKLVRRSVMLTLNLAVGISLAASTPEADEAAPLVKNANAQVLGKNVKVQVREAIVDIGSQSTERPEHANNSCTYSRFPCKIVTSMRIVVDGNQLFVPRSVFADLSDITHIELVASGKQLLLAIKGGDASEAYSVKVLFSKNRVVKRLIYSALQHPPVEETTYFKTEQLN